MSALALSYVVVLALAQTDELPDKTEAPEHKRVA